MAAARSVWKGAIRFSLVVVPVKAYASNARSEGISLNQLHAACNSRIRYVKSCPLHGEVPASEIVSGYEYTKGQYVVIDADELEKLRSPAEKAINIESFIKSDAIDPAYYAGNTWYLLPDGPMAPKPYTLLHRAMVEQGRSAFARVVIRSKEQLMLVRPLGELLAMTWLSYPQEVRAPSEYEPEVIKSEVQPQELKMAKLLMDQIADKEFDISEYKDDYVEKMAQLIEAKVQGKEVVAAPAEKEPPQMGNLMEALQQSLAQAKKQRPAASKPPKQAAPGTAARGKDERKRKTS